MTGEKENGQKPLKLRAHDAEDMDVLAALLQDALVPLPDIAYRKREKRFVFVANRFLWSGADAEEPAAPAQAREGDAAFEDAEDPPPFERANCGVCFDRVTAVRFKGMPAQARDEILSLLTIKTEPSAITLIFAGEAMIRLEVSAIRCHLEDLGEGWPTRWQPQHAFDGEASAE